jgi:hypothetical protein
MERTGLVVSPDLLAIPAAFRGLMREVKVN